MLDRFFVVVVFHILPWDSTENPIGQIPHQGFREMTLKKKKKRTPKQQPQQEN